MDEDVRTFDGFVTATANIGHALSRLASVEDATLEAGNCCVAESTKTPLEMLKSGMLVKIAAPMVRYSKLPFRTICRKWGCDVVYTPMIVARTFNRSAYSRDTEFTTSTSDRPLVVQFAACDADEFSAAASHVKPYCDAVDLNCGCPQRRHTCSGYGAALLRRPELILDIVQRTTAATDGLPVAIKIRKVNALSSTVEMCRRAEKVNAAWITVHGRTAAQRSSEPVDFEAIRIVRESVSIPVVANGDIFSLSDANALAKATGVAGVMAARGLLENPALFSGYDLVPMECVANFIDLALNGAMPFHLFHQQLMYMMHSIHSRGERVIFNQLKSTSAVLDYFDTFFPAWRSFSASEWR